MPDHLGDYPVTILDSLAVGCKTVDFLLLVNLIVAEHLDWALTVDLGLMVVKCLPLSKDFYRVKNGPKRVKSGQKWVELGQIGSKLVKNDGHALSLP